MTMTIRPASTIMFIGLLETNTIGYYSVRDSKFKGAVAPVLSPDAPAVLGSR